MKWLRNHPSVVMYSTDNEIFTQAWDTPEKLDENIRNDQLGAVYGRYVGELDPTRLVTRDGDEGTWGKMGKWEEEPPAEIANYIRDELLVAVINEGSAASSMPRRYRVLGKTGTTKLTEPGRKGYVSGQYQSTFLGAAPAADPEIIVLVMIRRPDPAIGYYGATVAAPSAGRIIDQALAYLEVPPDRHVELAGM